GTATCAPDAAARAIRRASVAGRGRRPGGSSSTMILTAPRTRRSTAPQARDPGGRMAKTRSRKSPAPIAERSGASARYGRGVASATVARPSAASSRAAAARPSVSAPDGGHPTSRPSAASRPNTSPVATRARRSMPGPSPSSRSAEVLRTEACRLRWRRRTGWPGAAASSSGAVGRRPRRTSSTPSPRTHASAGSAAACRPTSARSSSTLRAAAQSRFTRRAARAKRWRCGSISSCSTVTPRQSTRSVAGPSAEAFRPLTALLQPPALSRDRMRWTPADLPLSHRRRAGLSLDESIGTELRSPPTGSDNPNNVHTGFADLGNPQNPFKDWNIVFVSYCSCDVHFGDAAQDYPPHVEHRGYENARVVEKWAREHFVNPDEVFVTGSSAGAYGAWFNAPLHERVWPASKFEVLADAGN